MSSSVTTRLWISRVKDSGGAAASYYFLFSERPTPRKRYNGTVWFDGQHIEAFCPEKFHRMTPIRLKHGTCRQFDFTISATEIKE